jgi:hypothetical protein
MSTRWLYGVLLFAFGFGSALLMRLPAADAAAKEGVIEGGLKYVDGADFQLIHAAGDKNEYLVVVSRTPVSGTDLQPRVAYETEQAHISRERLQSLTIYRLVPLVRTLDRDIRKCRPGLCPVPPEPPPPGVKTRETHDYTFMASWPASSKPGQ